MDVDGTLTDGKIYMSANGELMKAFNIKDGYALAHLREYGMEPVIITGRKSEIVEKRCAELGIKELHQGVGNKVFCLKSICEKYDVNLSEVAYIGDDVNDMPCIQQCGYTACPLDAMNTVKEHVKYICETKGGDGAVREYIDYLISQYHLTQSTDGNYELQEIKYEVEPYTND